MSEQVKFSVLKPVHFTQKHTFRTGWRWGRDIERFIEKEVSRFDIERPILHVCSGSSKLGDITVDAAHPNASIRADMFHLPFRDEAVPTIICDPPYELNIRERTRLGLEIARVHRGGGRLIWKAPWLPLEGQYEIHDVTVQNIRAGLPRNAHLVTRARRRHRRPRK